MQVDLFINDCSEKKHTIIAIILFFCLLFLSFLFGFYSLSAVFQIYGVVFLLFIINLLVFGNFNPISSLFSIGVLLYFYQIPFIYQIAEKSEGSYLIDIKDVVLTEYLFLYSMVIFLNYIVVFYLRRQFCDWSSSFESLYFIKKLEKIIFPSLFLALLLLLLTIQKVGGVDSFLSLNKFESVEEAKILFFTWKDFTIISMSALVFSKNKNWIYFIVVFFLIMIEILTAKRLLMLCFIAFFYVSYVKKTNFLWLVAIFLLAIFSNLVKYTYYNLKNYFSNQIEITEIIWFEWSDFFKDSLLIGEFSGHIKLAYLSINYNINHSSGVFLEYLGSLIPLSSTLDLEYLTAGEYLRIYLNEPWIGLASSIYLNAYLSLSIIGLFLIYFLYLFIVHCIATLSRRFILFKLILISLIPFIFFYIQREELMIITRNIYVYFPISVLMLVLMLARKSKL